MNPTQNGQPDGMNAGPSATLDAAAQDHFSDMMTNRVGADDHDDGLVHGHQWAAAE